MCVLGMWDQTGALEENPRRLGEDIQTEIWGIAQRFELPQPSFSFISDISDIFNTNETASDIVNGIIDNIPLPQWTIYLLAALGVIVIVLVVCCVCVCCCRKRRKKQQQKQADTLVKQKQQGGQTNSELVQPGTNEVKFKQHRGKLLYSLEFDTTLSELKVGVKQASSLKAMDLGGTSDPYVKVYILPDKTKTCETKVLKNTLNATFNETFNFQEENLGEICFSLRYVPTSSKLTVIILEAKNLKSTDINGSSDPYVKVQLALDKRKWKKKKSTIKKNTLNPYYNEAFTFKVTLEQIRRVNLVISVWDHDPMTPNDPTGKIFLGCDAQGNQLRHWADMLANPRRPVAQWHTLLSSEQVNAALPLKRKIPLASVEKVNLLREILVQSSAKKF
ncbi:synaptotagmin-B-like isoform X3 [Corythoichthys intestinalis]|uniref:synaptotagmin-B-like isoform X3 n=1 Tax=Corythoichthys intestinalis TaxID=161448 RepID=UPI0025A5996A|nr:synaptotagmin-B-like isoform X3 [Corythoichthys intestinalis]